MGCRRQEYWSGLPFPSPGDRPGPGIKPRSPALQADSLPLSHQGSPDLSGLPSLSQASLQQPHCDIQLSMLRPCSSPAPPQPPRFLRHVCTVPHSTRMSSSQELSQAAPDCPLHLLHPEPEARSPSPGTLRPRHRAAATVNKATQNPPGERNLQSSSTGRPCTPMTALPYHRTYPCILAIASSSHVPCR